jgi:galactokinase
MKISISAPGRICLFGEHQDYFGFPVVAAAIDLRATIHSESLEERTVELILEDLDEVHRWSLDDLPHPASREYWLSALHIAKREGWLPNQGWKARVSSKIPKQAGASSSSALTAAWCATLAVRAGRTIETEKDREWIAHATWRSEVAWFNEPGGMMDQVLCAMGGVRRVHFTPTFQVETLPRPAGHWILIDSHEPKDTLNILARAKEERLKLLEAWGVPLGADWPEKRPARPVHWTAHENRLMDATVAIRQVSHLGGRAVESMPKNIQFIGEQLQVHHHWLSHGIGVSTPRIDDILNGAIDAGAFGGKINGSGGGGTAFVLTEAAAFEPVLHVIERHGASALPIELGAEGVRIDKDL